MKYSLMIPCYNALPYVKSAVELVLRQKYEDFELIISDDHSVDGTSEYIDSLVGMPHVVVLHCPARMSMAEHWDWCQRHASGDWQIFIGQDDGIQGYFFWLADELVNIAEAKKIDVIMSERAYYYWDGVEDLYGGVRLSFCAKNVFRVMNAKKEMWRKLLFLGESYMDIPSCYTTSLFSKQFIDKIRQKQEGALFITHPQDANLAASACIFSKSYLKSYVPLGWVGSSPKSAGAAMTKFSAKKEGLGAEYLNSIKKSDLPCVPLAGDFRIADLSLYFWGALLAVSERFDKKLYASLRSGKILKKLFSKAWHDINNSTGAESRLLMFKEVLELNGVKESDLGSPLKKSAFMKVCERISRRNWLKKNVSYAFDCDKNSSRLSLLELDAHISAAVAENGLLNKKYNAINEGGGYTLE